MIVKQWSLPQVLHSYIGKQEYDSANARQQFMLTMAAIGCSFSKNGNRIAQGILRDLDGPGYDVEDVMDTLSDTQLKVLFGQQAVEDRKKGKE